MAKKIRTKPTTRETICKCTELNFAITIRNLIMVFDFTPEQLNIFCEGYAALMDEVDDKRCSIKDFVDDTTNMTGVDVQELLKRTL